LARAVAVEVGSEVVSDADQPRAQRASVRFALGPLEVAVCLQECLLRQVLGIVVVSDAVVGVAVHVSEVSPVELRELGVELRLGLVTGLLAHSLHPTPASRPAAHAAREISAGGGSSRPCSPVALAPPSQS